MEEEDDIDAELSETSPVTSGYGTDYPPKDKNYVTVHFSDYVTS